MSYRRKGMHGVLGLLGVLCACFLLSSAPVQAQWTETVLADSGYNTKSGAYSANELADLQDQGVNTRNILVADWTALSFSNMTYTGYIVKSVVIHYNYGENGTFGANNANLAVGTGWQAGGGGTTWTNKNETPNNDGTVPFNERTWDVSDIVTNEQMVTDLQFKITNNDPSVTILYDFAKVVVTYDFPRNYGPSGVVAPRGPNPTNGSYWAAGDTYQLYFITSTTTNLSAGEELWFWNNYVNAVADASTNTGVSNVTWYVIASTENTDAKDNAVVSAPVYLMDGSTFIATNAADMWDGTVAANRDIDENGYQDPVYSQIGSGGRDVWTGTDGDGTRYDGGLNDPDGASCKGICTRNDSHWLRNGGDVSQTGNTNRFYALSQVLMITNGAADTTAPEPAQMSFAVAPAGLTTNQIIMTATLAEDLQSIPVEYLFTNETQKTSSGWQISRTWTETVPLYYTNGYRVIARDQAGNTNGWSDASVCTPILVGPNGVAAPNGAHPTGGIWQVGMTYHLFFLTSTEHTLLDGMEDIEHFNQIVNSVADGSSLPGMGDLAWYVVGSTRGVNARDNAVVSAPVYFVDGQTLFATNEADFWDVNTTLYNIGGKEVRANITEDNDIIPNDEGSPYYNAVWTGCTTDGNTDADDELDSINTTTKSSRMHSATQWLQNGPVIAESIPRRFWALSQPIIITTNGMPDNTPPTPATMSFVELPAGETTNTISMKAISASDLISTPVEYLFTNDVTGDSSGWQTDQYWTNAVTPFSSNSYRVIARDQVGNTNGWSAAASAYTLLTGPSGLPAPTGVNPDTGEYWKPGDVYHLVFLTTTRTNLAGYHGATYWNDYVSAVADGSIIPGLPDARWYAIGSTRDVDARDNAVVSGPVYLVDGESLVATNYADMWDSTIGVAIDMDENGYMNPVYHEYSPVNHRAVWTGSATDGTPEGPLDALDGQTKIGRCSATGADWIRNGNGESSGTNVYRFYALSQKLIITSDTPDTNAPDPNPMTWRVEPTPGTLDTITMRATTAVDPASTPVEYFFTNTVTGETSGWQEDSAYDAPVSRGSVNAFKVMARDSAGNMTDWSGAVTSTPLLQGEYGVMAPTGVNPTNNGELWGIGDQYHLVLVSSGTDDLDTGDRNIAWWNNYVNTQIADSSSRDGVPAVTWYIVGSTSNTAAKSNAVVSAPVCLMDAVTIIATNATDMWDGTIAAEIKWDENGDEIAQSSRAWTGSMDTGLQYWGRTLDNGLATATEVGNIKDNFLSAWLENQTRTSTETHHFYALSELLTIQIPPNSISITNLAETDVTTTSATFNATLRAALFNVDVTVFWGETNGLTDPLDWADSQDMGTFDHVILTNISLSTNGLTPDTQYYYTFRCTNAVTNVWASPSEGFFTFAPAGSLTVTNNGGATNIGQGTATLVGEIADGGQADLYFCWGEEDGGTNGVSGWDNVVEMGLTEEAVAVSNDLSGLWYGIEYNYRVLASNDVETTWSAVDTFKTLIPTIAKVAPGNMNVTCSGHWDGHDNAVDGSGLTGNTHGNDPDTMWMTDGGSVSQQWLKIDLGSTYQLEYLRVWNYNDAFWAQYDRGLHIGDVLIATNNPGNNTEGTDVFDTNGWSELIANYNFAEANGSPVLENTDSHIDLSNTTARCLAIRVDSAWHGDDSDNYVGLSEMQIYYYRDGAWQLENTSATNILSTTATLRGELECQGSVFDVYVFWSTNDNANSAAWFADGDASSAFIAGYTNHDEQVLSKAVGSLTPNSVYYYTLMATNDCTNVWASPNASFATLDAPAVDNSTGATPVSATSATLRGEMTHGMFASGYICWGSIDGGTDSTGDWQNVVSIGSVTQDVEFSAIVAGLTMNASYWYRCYVTNAVGEDWADSAASFGGTPVGGSGTGGACDFKVQRGEIDIPANETTVTITAGVDYEAPSAIDRAFIRLVNNRLSGAGKTSASYGAAYVTATIPNATNLLNSVTFERTTADANYTRLAWEIVEYIGHPGGANEMIVRAQGETNMASGVGSVTGAVVSAVSDDNDIVVFITGQRTDATGSGDMDHALHTSGWLAGSDQPSFTRSQTASAASVSYAVVEWKGLNWVVQRVTHDQVADNVEETISITNPVNSLARTFIHAQVRSSEGQIDEQGLEIWLSDTNQVSSFLQGGGSAVQDAVVWIVENTETDTNIAMRVQHLQYGDPGAGDGVYWINSIPTPIQNTTNTSVMGENGRCSGTGTTWPSGVINMRIVSTNEVQCWYADSNKTPTYRYSIVEWPGTLLGGIANQPPTNITSSSANLNAVLSNFIGTNCDVYVHWGLSDGGTNMGGWDQYYHVGSWTNVISTNITYLKTGLSGGTTNWYTFRASNATDNVWSSPSWMFITPPQTAPGNQGFLFEFW